HSSLLVQSVSVSAVGTGGDPARYAYVGWETDESIAQFVEAGLMLPTSVPGVYGYEERFEAVVAALQSLLDAEIGDEAGHTWHFSPLLPREVVERSGYVTNMPHLLGCVHAFVGDDDDYWRLAEDVAKGRDWSSSRQPTEVALAPAVCHNDYPLLRDRATGPRLVVDARARCYRHESSAELARLQSFRMREFVCAGEPDEVVAWRDEWIGRSAAVLTRLGIDADREAAADPFFSKAHRLMRLSQETDQLKVELRAEVPGLEGGCAVASINYHKDHFATAFEIGPGDPERRRHTACVGFGLERMAIALFANHGFDSTAWPGETLEALGLAAAAEGAR